MTLPSAASSTSHQQVTTSDRPSEIPHPPDGVSAPTPLVDRILPNAEYARKIIAISNRCATKTELVQSMAKLVSGEPCNAMWLISKDQEGNWTAPVGLLGTENDIPPIANLIVSTTRKALANQQLICADVAELPGHCLITAAVFVDQTPTDILSAIFPASIRGGPPPDVILLLITQEIARWQSIHHTRSHQVQIKCLSDFVNISAAINRAANRIELAIVLVNELKSMMQARQVCLLLRSPGQRGMKLVALSDVESFDPQSQNTQVIESTVIALKDDQEGVHWSKNTPLGPDGDDFGATFNLQRYGHKFSHDACAILPLRSEASSLFGWLLFGFSEKEFNTVSARHYMKQLVSLISGQLDVAIKSQRTLAQITLDNLKNVSKKRWTRVVAGSIGLFMLLMCVPWSYKIKCDCQLQLTERRFIAAPFNGLLESALVENGDVVQENQLLAKMEGRQLRMEQSSLSADLQSEHKARDSALARGDIAESQIAAAEMKRIDSELQIVQKRLEHIEIRSPIDGVIVSGDLDKAQGAPLEMGQNLFEVGPLETMLVEILIPEAEIQYAEGGMTVYLEFSAYPFESFSGKVERIHPRAELIEDQSVFVAEIRLDNSAGMLRPGMEGRAKIVGHRYPLGWNLFHHAWESARSWLIW